MGGPEECVATMLASRGDGRQHDAHEFQKAVFATTASPVLTGIWIRKMQYEDAVKTMDRGTVKGSNPPLCGLDLCLAFEAHQITNSDSHFLCSRS